jgi:hypothetical protein
LRVIDLAKSAKKVEFRSSLTVAIAPFFALGREALFLPYSPYSARAYLDLLFGNLAVCTWVLLSDANLGRRASRALTACVLTGCGYWYFNAVENVLFLAWSPVGPGMYRAFARAHLPVPLLSVAYALAASVLVLVISKRNLLGLGRRLGVSAGRA